MAGSRGTWNSRFGFIMAAVGSAVGLGNLVRFPREVAGQGGAAFLVIYLALLLFVGLPAILGEMSLGKMAQLSPVRAFQKLGGPNGKRWAILGVFGMLAAVFVMFFYSVMTGWTLRFFLATFTDGWFSDPDGYYNAIAFGPAAMMWHALVGFVVVMIVARGISGGIEKATIVMMPALFAIITGVVVYALFQPGMAAGYKELFAPDFSEISPNNVARAVGQVFFSLSLGQGAMLTYASYMEKKQSVTKDGTITAVADTGVAIMAGMMIFPILGFTGLLTNPQIVAQMEGGSFGTAFIALPNAFVTMGPVAGRIIGGVFFLGLFFAAMSSAISLIEVPVSVMVDNLNLPRWKAATIAGLVIYTVGVISATSETWFVLFDEIAINFFIVIGVALTTVFAGWVVPGVAKELDTGLKSRVGVYIVWLMRTITPVLILVTFVFGGLWGTDDAGNIVFWADNAGWNRLGHEFARAFGAA